MVTITDVSPTRSNMSFGPDWRDVSGRMLSLASSDDGSLVFAGSLSSGLWVSEDGGESWVQLAWEQPAPDQFGVPGALGGCCIPSIAVGPEPARWLVERNPLFLADITGDGKADIIGFGDTGVWTAIGNGDGTFQAPRVVLNDFCFLAGGWHLDRHPRFLADITGDGKADIVGFGDAGVWTARSNGDGTFQAPAFVLPDLGFDQGWRVDKHPRFLADITGEGRADIVGFGDAGVWTARSNGDGSFQANQFVLADLGFDQGWRVEKHPRLLADLTGDGRADIVGFGDAGVWMARSNGDGSFQPPQFVLADFGFEAGGWRVENHRRFLADLTGDGTVDIVGFGDAGVYVALTNTDGVFEGPVRFVLANFGHLLTVLAIVRSDREVDDAGIWRSTNGGGTWSPVHSFPRPGGRPPAAGQLVWTPGSAHLVFAAGQDSLAVSRDAGATWKVATRRTSPIQPPTAVPANHVAVAATPAGELRPPAVYALAGNKIEISLDGGETWVPDAGTLPTPIGGAVGLANSQNECVMVVSPRSPFEVFVTRNANAHPNLPRLFRGDFSDFAQTKASTWQDVPIPKVGGQDSGNVWLAITRPGQGEALFYGPQRFFGDNIGEASVASLDPQSESDWKQLDTTAKTHVDLHGLFLSPDFHAGFEDGRYVATAGTVWMLSDGGVDRSTDGGITFHPAGSISSLSTVNLAGAAVAGQGPLLSLNTGDNDGFASRDGGQHWRPMEYGGGDNDTSWADPLRPHSMLVFTPRRDKTVTLYETQLGNLPDISSSNHQRTIPGPPLRKGSNIWNASSGFGIRGHRPLIQNLPSEDPSLPTDYVCIRFYGNFSRDDGTPVFSDHLAVLLRARELRRITKRTDWDTPGGWLVDRHPRLLADLTGDGKADIVGFGDAGVWAALSRNSGGLFADPQFVLADLGFEQGWRVEKHPRVLADLTADGKADIVGFGKAGVWTARSNGDGTFQANQFVLADLGFEQGWRVEKHPRFLADLTADGKADIVGFGDAGVWTALSSGDGSFQPHQFVLAEFGFDQGWRVDKHPRFVADITGDGKADIVGFGDAGVWTALSNGDGSFQPAQFVLADLGVDSGWRVEKHPRFLADLTGDGKADIVGFGDAGVWTALSNGDGSFQPPQFVLADLGFESGWRVERHPRLLADLTNDGQADIVGFGQAGVFVAVSNGDGSFAFTPELALDDFGFGQDWRVENHLRFLADVTGPGSRADIVGFGDAGVFVAPTRDDVTFREQPLFVIPNFGRNKSGPVEQVGPLLPDPGIGVVQASGGREGTVFYVGNTMAKKLWKWTEGMAAWQQLIPGGGAGQAKRFFVSPYDPNLLYVIDDKRIKRSDNGGVSWQVDESLERMVTCNGRIPADRDEASDTTQVVLSDMQFDPFDGRRRFAVGLAGAFMTTDGVTWERLLDTGAMRGLPTNCFFDQFSVPSDPSLYVAFAGRGIVEIRLSDDVILLAEPREDEPERWPLERPTTRVRIADGREGTAEIAPDDRYFVTLDDGPTIAVHADEVTVLDGSALVSD